MTPATSSVCAQVRVLLPGYVGDELTPSQLRRTREHLRQCHRCRKLAVGYLQMQKALERAAVAAAERADVPFEEMYGDIMRQVDELDALPSPEVASGHRLMFVAAAVLLAAFGFWLAAEVEPPSIWRGPALAEPAPDKIVRVLPYAGPAAELVPAALDHGDGSHGLPADGGSGMMLRGRLRPAVDVVDPIWISEPAPRDAKVPDRGSNDVRRPSVRGR